MNNTTSPKFGGISLLKTLRALVPPRPLSYREAERIAELQASRFRELLGVTQAELPEVAISDLPRLHVTREYDLPVSGLAQWSNGRWLVALNGNEPPARRRFSLAHELFHIINHTTGAQMHPDLPSQPGILKAERLADYFAGCLLMPKRHVKRLSGEGRGLELLADEFSVSPRAMQVRLSQLGLVEPVPRCVRIDIGWKGRRNIYHRVSVTAERVSA